MASRAKSNKPTSTRGKPAPTIDLKAKEVASQAADSTGKATDAETSSDKVADKAAPAETKKPEKTSGSLFGRQKKPADEKPESTKTQKPEEKSKPEANTKAKPAAKKSEAKSGAGFGAMLFSALLGGTATVAGLGAIGQMDGADKLPLIGNIYSSPGQENSGFGSNAQIGALQAQIDKLSANQQSIITTDVDLVPINERLSAVETAITSLTDPNTENTSSNKLAELETRLENLSQSLSEMASLAQSDGASNPQVAAALSDMGTRLANIESQVASVQANSTVSETLNDTLTRIDNLESGLAGLSTPQVPDITPLSQQVTALENTTAELLGAVEQNSQSLETLEESSAQINAQIESAQSSQKIARSVALNSLGSALENGDALSIPVTSIATLIGETAETKRLSELAEQGIASIPQLRSRFENFVDQASAGAPVSENDGLIASLLSSAKSLVKVTPAGPISGQEPQAIFSRIRAALGSGNLDTITAEWVQLPEDMRLKGKGWISQVKARKEAFALFDTISNSLSGNDG